MLDGMLSWPITQRLGWALLHFLWQGALVAVLMRWSMWFLRRRSANVRYVLLCAGMLAMLALPLATMALVTPAAASQSPGATAPPDAVAPGAPTPKPIADNQTGGTLVPTAPVPGAPDAPRGPAAHTSQSWLERGSRFFRPWLPWVVCAWLVGVLALSVRHLRGWLRVQKLRTTGTQPMGRRIRETLHRLCQRLSIPFAVLARKSSLIAEPVTLGWIRPVILLPASVVTGLSPEQLEAVLVHELAHVRRYDYLVNLIQTVVETLLFYHPAVWWVSRQMRVEREHCCDDVTVGVCGEGRRLAEALALLSEGVTDHTRPAIAAAGHPLKERIHRILGRTEDDADSRSTWLAGALTLVVVLVVGVGFGAAYAVRPRASVEPGEIEIPGPPVEPRPFELRVLRPKEIAPMHTFHGGGGVVAMEGKLYIWGGLGPFGRVHHDRIPDAEAYDPASDQWTKLPPLPEARSGIGCFALHGKLYSIGGERNPAGSFDRWVLRYDPAKEYWETLHPFPTTAWHVLCTVCLDKAYAIGGRQGYGRSFPHVWEYDEQNDRWVRKADIPRRVIDAGIASAGGKIYVIGGTHYHAENDREHLKIVQIYDPVADKWAERKMPVVLMTPRAVLVGESIWIFSRQFRNADGKWVTNHWVYRYTPDSDTWRKHRFDWPEKLWDDQPLAAIDGHVYLTPFCTGDERTTKVMRLDLRNPGPGIPVRERGQRPPLS